ncbi:hypothetical protein P9H32_01285 [Pontiella sp. NLcol2]|uniref:Lipoprotein n=2 Tax=Pontiella agarivorans TaxID=3038953 RepID=A0ABU5MSR9_9BACT|nr:hypothetical protein [Pontiella agarivorans]
MSKTWGFASLLVVLTAGCTHLKNNKPIEINTDQNSPLRMHVYDWNKDQPDSVNANQILLLPPLGIEDQNLQTDFYHHLYGGAQRRFASSLKIIRPDSAYAPYIEDRNLMRNDGSLDLKEVAFLGALMNCTYVICPNVREMIPYHPQRIDISLLLINSGTGKICAEFAGVFDAKNRDIYDYFIEYSNAHKSENESKDDLGFKIKSPAAYQAFVSDMCGTVMADRLSL